MTTKLAQDWGSTITIVAPSALTVDVPIAIGAGLFGVPTATFANGASATLAVGGVFNLTKTGGGGMYGFMGAMPDQYNVSVNSNHPMAQKIISAAEETRQLDLAKQAYDLALLSQGMLTGADLTQFIRRSVEMAAQ